jgi:hypothetical protein
MMPLPRSDVISAPSESPVSRPFLSRAQDADPIGVDKHPALRVAYAISLLTGTVGDADYALAHRVLADVLKDEHAPDKLKGRCAAALGDSARLGRGEEVDLELARTQYETASGFGMRDAAHTLGLYWKKGWSGAASPRCMARLEALTTK